MWSRTKESAARLTEAGATAHPSPDHAVAHADVVITMLPDAAAVTSVAVDQGMAKALAGDAIWAQMGTIGVRASSWRTSWLAGARTCGSSTHRSQGPVGLPRLAKIDAADDAPDFSLRWALKDVDLAVGAERTGRCQSRTPSAAGGMSWWLRPG